MTKAATVTEVSYFYKGQWFTLGLSPPTPSLNTDMSLSVTWANTGTENVRVNIALVVDKPDGSVVHMNAYYGQDNWVAPGGSCTVRFEPVTLDQSGQYVGHAFISETDGLSLGSPLHFTFANVGAVGADLMSAILPFVLIMMMFGMMIPMMRGMTKELGAGE